MSFQKVLKDIGCDLDRYRILHTGGFQHRSRLWILFLAQGAQASSFYRIGHWIYTSPNSASVLMRILRIIYVLLSQFSTIMTGIFISPLAEIGPGLFIGHFGSIIVGAGVVIGRNCNLSQGVTIGIGGRGDKAGAPRIGGRIYIAAGAKVFGPIEIGDDVAIGANAVVTRSIPDRAVVVGIPARVISFQGSFEFVSYSGMESDPARTESLALRSSEIGECAEALLGPNDVSI